MWLMRPMCLSGVTELKKCWTGTASVDVVSEMELGAGSEVFPSVCSGSTPHLLVSSSQSEWSERRA